VLAGLTAYSNSLSGPLISDDIAAITENPTIRRLWSLGDVLSPPCDGRTLTSRPLVNVSLAINYSLGGEDVWGYHVVNMVIHLLGGLLLLGVLRRTFQLPTLQPQFGKAAWGLALAIALVWTVHPLQTESVTYIIQRAESLAAMFYLLTLYSVIRASQSSRAAWWHALAVVACWLGVAAKEPAISAPLVVLLYDRTFLEESFTRALRRRWGLYVGLFASWPFQVHLQAKTGTTVLVDQLGNIGFWGYVRSEPAVILYYLRLSLWPHPLCFDYAWPVADTLGTILPGVLAIGTLVAVTAWGLFKRRQWAVPGAAFFLILAPTSSIMPLKQLAFEHRMYLSLAAVVTLVAVGLYLAGCRLMETGWISSRSRLALNVALTIAVAGAFVFLTMRRNEAYRNAISIWEDTLATAPHNVEAHNNLGNAFLQEGDIRKAIECHQHALRIKPDGFLAHNNLANLLLKLGRTNEAVEHYRQAVDARPDLAQSHDNFGIALTYAGRSSEALEHFDRAIRIKPSYAEAHYDWGNALLGLDRPAEAIEHYQAALRIRPEYVQAHTNLGVAMGRLGRLTEAVDHFQQAVRLDPDYADAHYNWANALRLEGHVEDAIEHYRQALRTNPSNLEAQFALSLLLAQTGRCREAIDHGCQAVRLASDRPDVCRFAAWLMATHDPADGGDPSRAVKLAERACAITARRDVASLDTLAAAYASAGRFDEAEATAKEAWQLASSTGQNSLAEATHIRMQLYRDRKPYRESAAASRPGP
jgi:tetratricopeptide (TPR) repeat protein